MSSLHLPKAKYDGLEGLSAWSQKMSHQSLIQCLPQQVALPLLWRLPMVAPNFLRVSIKSVASQDAVVLGNKGLSRGGTPHSVELTDYDC